MMKTFMKQLLLLAMIFVTITATGSNKPQQQSNSGVTQEYRTAVKALLDVADYEKRMREKMVSIYKQLGQEDNPYIDDFINQLIEKMPDKMVEIYSKYFTLDEIKQLTELNKNEIQKKLLSVQNNINQDLMLEGQCFAAGKKSPSDGIVVTKDFEKAMREYFEVSGLEEQMGQIYSLIENTYGLPSGALNELKEQMPKLMMRNYSKYFTTSEIKQATALAKTPCLKKFNEKIPAITQDALEVTRQIVMDYFKNLQ